MKITVITSPFGALPPMAIGAVEKLFHQLAGEWTQSGNQVTFVCAGGGDNSKIEYVRLSRYGRTGSTKKDIVLDFVYSVKALWKCPKTDILLCNTFWTPCLAPLFRWKYKKLIYGVHRYPKRQFFLYPLVHKFICVSAAVAEPLKKQISSRRICVVVNPIDTEVFAPEPREIVKGRVLYAGRIHPLKGLRCLAEACGNLFASGIVKELVLVGPYEKVKGGGGEEFVNELKVRAEGCPVNLIGAISDSKELAKIERAAEVFVYPSEDATGEAFGIAPLEAMALGVPTIVSGLKCFDEFVQEGENALKFRTGDKSDLAEKLQKLMSDESARAHLSKAAASTTSRFSVANVAQDYLKEFASDERRVVRE